MRKKGFTLVEVMIIVLIISVLLSIAIPQFMTARAKASKRSCQSNMRLYDTAKAQAAIDKNLPPDYVIVDSDIAPYLRQFPQCPAGGTYDYGTVSDPTRCSLAEHPRIEEE